MKSLFAHINVLLAARRSLIYGLILLAGLAWIAGTAALAAPTSGARPPAPRQGFGAPDFTLASLAGPTYQLSAQKGHPVIVNIWASWCGPCQAEMPMFEALYNRYHAQGLEILAVNSTIQDSSSGAAAFAADKKLTFPILLDEQGTVTHLYEVQALPTTFFIDRSGVIHNQVIGGPISEALAESEVQQMLAGGQ